MFQKEIVTKETSDEDEGSESHHVAWKIILRRSGPMDVFQLQESSEMVSW
jgi:hypothetical protein